MLRFFTALAALFMASAAHAACTPTPLVIDGVTLNAERVYLSGEVTLANKKETTTCNIWAFFGPGVTGRAVGNEISGADYFGIATLEADVNVRDNRIKDVGIAAIYCAFSMALPTEEKVIRGNIVWDYGKTGIVLTGPNCSNKRVEYNTTLGKGPLDSADQSGIEVSLGAQNNLVQFNTIRDHVYKGPNSMTGKGIDAFGGDWFGGAVVRKNIFHENYLTNNDIGISILNLDATGTRAMGLKTGNIVGKNRIFQDRYLNKHGFGAGLYQVGIAMAVSGDSFLENDICGRGYHKPPAVPGGRVAPMDPTGSRDNLTVLGNHCDRGWDEDSFAGTSVNAQAPYKAFSAALAKTLAQR